MNPMNHRSNSTRGKGQYVPYQDLLDGEYQQMVSSGDEDDFHTPPLYGSSRHNARVSHERVVRNRSRSPHLSRTSDNISELCDSTIISMIQEQQKLIQCVLKTQKKMQSKQDDLDYKIQELTKRSESSSSSPESIKKKFRISRALTVST